MSTVSAPDQFDAIVIGDHPAALQEIGARGRKNVLQFHFQKEQHSEWVKKSRLHPSAQVLTPEYRWFLWDYERFIKDNPGSRDLLFEEGILDLATESQGPVTGTLEDWRARVNESLKRTEEMDFLLKKMDPKLTESWEHRTVALGSIAIKQSRHARVQVWKGAELIAEAPEAIIASPGSWVGLKSLVPAAWVYSVDLVMPEEWVPIGVSEQMIWKERGAPPLILLFEPAKKKGEIKLRLQTWLKTSEDYKNRESLDRVDQKMFALVTELFPFAGDLSTCKKEHDQWFDHFEELPSYLRVYDRGTRGFGRKTPWPLCTRLSCETDPLRGILWGAFFS